MSDRQKKTTGSCLCGAVRYEADGKPLVIGHCHCETCRRHTGAPMVTFVAFEGRNVRFPARERSIYNSSPNVKRAFCNLCGTPLTWEGKFKGYDIIEFHISTTDDPNSYKPDLHWHHEEKLSWFECLDELPRYKASNAVAKPYAFGPVTESSSKES